MKFTKEEISLCKQVAEKYRKEIEYGDWYISIDNEVYLWESKSPFNKEFVDICEPQNQADKIIPLWTISDCLEWLQEKVETVELWRTKTTKKWICRLRNGKWYKANVPLESCLKAVLAVLEEKK